MAAGDRLPAGNLLERPEQLLQSLSRTIVRLVDMQVNTTAELLRQRQQGAQIPPNGCTAAGGHQNTPEQPTTGRDPMGQLFSFSG